MRSGRVRLGASQTVGVELMPRLVRLFLDDCGAPPSTVRPESAGPGTTETESGTERGGETRWGGSGGAAGGSRTWSSSAAGPAVALAVESTRRVAQAVARGDLDAALVGGAVPPSLLSSGAVLAEPYLTDRRGRERAGEKRETGTPASAALPILSPVPVPARPPLSHPFPPPPFPPRLRQNRPRLQPRRPHLGCRPRRGRSAESTGLRLDQPLVHGLRPPGETSPSRCPFLHLSFLILSLPPFPSAPQPTPPHLPHPSGRQREILRSAGVDADSLRVRFEVNSVEAVKNAVEEGIGVAFVSAAAAERELAAGLLKEVRLTQRGGGGGGKTGGARRQPTFRRHDLSDSSLGDGEDGGGGKDGDGANGADGEPLLLTRELLLITNPRRYLTAAARAFLRQMRRAQPLFQAKSSLVLLLL